MSDSITKALDAVAGIELTINHWQEETRQLIAELEAEVTAAGMGADRYQELAMRTSAEHAEPDERLLNGVLGLCGESGEVADIVKKHRFHGTTLDEEKLRKELGDVLWYVAQICDSRGWKMGRVMEVNIEKLKARWPEGFATGDAAHEESRARDGASKRKSSLELLDEADAFDTLSCYRSKSGAFPGIASVICTELMVENHETVVCAEVQTIGRDPKRHRRIPISDLERAE